MAAKKYTVKAEKGLNLREKPGKDSAILALLPFGLQITAEAKEGLPEGWLAVKDVGYVMAEYLK